MTKIKVISFILFFLFSISYSQITVNSTMGLPTGTTAEIIALIPANLGSIAYSTTENVIYKYNGTAWVTIGGDNLGNHIATQNIETNGNFISGDGGDEGIVIDNNGNVGISNTTGFIPQRQFHVSGPSGGIRLDRIGADAGADAFFFFVNIDQATNNVLQNWGFINDRITDTESNFEIRNFGTAVGGNALFTPFRIKDTNQLQLPAYGTPTTFDDNTVTKLLGVQGDGDVVQVDTSTLGGGGTVYEKIVIWAEEAAALSDNTLEWSFGNNATGQIGIPLPEEWEAYAVSFNSDINGATDTVEMAVIDSNTNTNLFTFTANGALNNIIYTEILATPVAIPAGTSIGFRTVNETGTVSDARVAVFLRRTP